MPISDPQKAAAYLTRARAVLTKELPGLGTRQRKWAAIRSQATNNGNDAAGNQAFDAYSAAEDYSFWLKRIIAALKNYSISTSTDAQTTAFVKSILHNGKETNKSLGDYATEKGRFVDRFAKLEWVDPQLDWIKGDDPNFGPAYKVLIAFTKLAS